MVAQRVAPVARELFVRGDRVLAVARIADRREPPAVAFLERRFARAHELFVRRGRDRMRHQRARVVDEHARRRAVRVAQDAAAGWIGRRRDDAGQLHRLRVGEQRVTVDAVQHDGAVADRGAQRVVRRKALVGPEVLVPAVADDPRIARRRRERDGSAHDLLERGGVREIDLVQRQPTPVKCKCASMSPGSTVAPPRSSDLCAARETRARLRASRRRRSARRAPRTLARATCASRRCGSSPR